MDNSSVEAITSIFMAFAGVLFALLIVIFIVAIIVLIANWKIMSKGKEEGWKAIIPVYNNWTMCKIVGLNPYWAIVCLVGAVLSGIPVIGIFAGLIEIYFYVIYCLSLAKSFGRSTGFGIGLLFLSPIFLIILGFGKSEYQGPQPVNDVIMNLFNKNNGNNTNSQQPVNNLNGINDVNNINTFNNVNVDQNVNNNGMDVPTMTPMNNNVGNDMNNANNNADVPTITPMDNNMNNNTGNDMNSANNSADVPTMTPMNNNNNTDNNNNNNSVI